MIFYSDWNKGSKIVEKSREQKKPPLPKGRGTTEGGGGIYGEKT